MNMQPAKRRGCMQEIVCGKNDKSEVKSSIDTYDLDLYSGYSAKYRIALIAFAAQMVKNNQVRSFELFGWFSGPNASCELVPLLFPLRISSALAVYSPLLPLTQPTYFTKVNSARYSFRRILHEQLVLSHKLYACTSRTASRPNSRECDFNGPKHFATNEWTQQQSWHGWLRFV